MRSCLLVLLFCTGLSVLGFAQGVPPRAKSDDYPAKAALVSGANTVLAAESLARSLPVEGGVLFAEDHLVIEVAFFGPVGRVAKIATEDFVLTINGKKVPLLPDTPGAVAMSMRDSPWNTKPTLEANGSINDAGVIVGGRRPTTGVPDLDGRNRGPQPPRAPGSDDRSGGPAKEPIDINQAVTRAALASCECKMPVAGLLYFPYKGKLKKIESMTLHHTPAGDKAKTTSLSLLP